jgi:hypothetical protein
VKNGGFERFWVSKQVNLGVKHGFWGIKLLFLAVCNGSGCFFFS